MKLKRITILLLVIALVTGTLASLGASSYIRKTVNAYQASIDARYRKVRVVVAAANLPAGTELTSANVSARPIPRAFLHDDAIPVERWSAYQGKPARVDLTEGAPLLLSQIDQQNTTGFTKALEPGKRALTVPVDQITSISGLLAPGDRVDILLSLNRADVRRTLVLLTDIHVLATGIDTDRDPVNDATGGRTPFNTVTMLVDRQQAAKLVHAQEEGRLSVVLRGEKRDTGEWPEKVTLANLIGEPEPEPEPETEPVVPVVRPGVEVILGGEGGAARHER